MKCLKCKKDFEPLTVIQKYCSSKCGQEYRKNNEIKYESVTFECSWCSKTVVTEPESRDKRTRFCSRECEKKYWKKPHYEHKSNFQNTYLRRRDE